MEDSDWCDDDSILSETSRTNKKSHHFLTRPPPPDSSHDQTSPTKSLSDRYMFEYMTSCWVSIPWRRADMPWNLVGNTVNHQRPQQWTCTKKQRARRQLRRLSPLERSLQTSRNEWRQPAASGTTRTTTTVAGGASTILLSHGKTAWHPLTMRKQVRRCTSYTQLSAFV